MKINLPTKLTLLRLFLIPPFLFLVSRHALEPRLLAFIIFGLAGLTDYYDGKLARKYHMETTLGKFLDPLADKLLISTALISFVEISELGVPAWMVVLIIGREFLITGLRTLAVSAGRVLPAMRAGKFKTTSQIVSILTILIIMCVNAYLADYCHIPRGDLMNRPGMVMYAGYFLSKGPFWLVTITTFLTVVSGYIYLNQNRDLFTHHVKSR